MDNSFSGNANQFSKYGEKSPLRRRKAPERDTLQRGTAEKNYGNKEARVPNEEEEYNRRREEEIRKQIQAKDEKIQNLSRASDYLKNRMETDPNRYTKDSTVSHSQGRSLPERDRSPY